MNASICGFIYGNDDRFHQGCVMITQIVYF